MMSKDFAFGQAMAAAAYGYHPALYGTHLASPFGWDLTIPNLDFHNLLFVSMLGTGSFFSLNTDLPHSLINDQSK